MALTWKDFVTTALALITAGFSYLMVTGYKFPLISGYRQATLVLLILGIGMCALSSPTPVTGNLFIMLASVLGFIALILIIAGFIFGTKNIFLALTGIIILLWFIATFRHIFLRPVN